MELLVQDAFFEAMAGIKQQAHSAALVFGDINAGDVADFSMISDRGDRALAVFQDLDLDLCAFWQDRAAPMAGPKYV